jgi:hypothetical protein
MTRTGSVVESPSVMGERVLAQHQEIHALAEEIGRTAELPHLLPRLVRLRALLVEHFECEEEAGGFYETVRAMTPRLVGWVDQLQREHQALLASVDGLAVQAQSLAALVERALGEAKALTFRLARHEAEEEQVLNETVNTDLGLGE